MAVVLATAVASCTVGPDFEPPSPPETKGYTEEKEGLPAMHVAEEKEGLPAMHVAEAKEKEQHLLLGKDIPGQW